ncbi:hypothetical protein DPMN_190062 [Dreissena polymorpha]|uniref:Uncharacterized protein n=1 Tax=Dreissena polymorpha TaxID=45954 RepID=A0A9D4DU94_DREPO|nr:hypothetical protein DPMN_190062 [Dreissena polymorpha]
MSPNFLNPMCQWIIPVECKEFSDSPVVRITIRKVSKMNLNVSCDDLPKEMFVKRLDLNRRCY